MSALDVLIRLSSTGGDSVQAALRGIASASSSLNDNIKGTTVSVAALRQRMQETGETIGGAAKSFGLTGQAATDAANAFRKAANDEKASINELKSAVGEEANAVKAAKDKEAQATQFAAQMQAKAATDYRENLQGIRTAGMAIAGAGIGGMMLEQKMIATSVAAEGVEKRLQSILRVQGRMNDAPALEAKINQTTEEGHFANSNEIRNATVLMASYSMQTEHIQKLLPDIARQARTMGLSLDEVANQFSKAYGSGNIAQLRRAGVALDAHSIAAVKAAYAISQTNGQMEFMKAVTAAVEKNTVSLGDSLSRTEAAANDMAREGNTAMKVMGKGAGEAQTIVYGLLTSILHVTNASPGLEHAAGFLGYFVSGGAAAIGSLMSILSQLALMSLAMTANGVTAGSMWATMTTGAVAAGAATWAAMLPILAVMAAILAGVLLVIAAYKVLGDYIDSQYSQNNKMGDAADEKNYEIAQKVREKRGQTRQSKEEFDAGAQPGQATATATETPDSSDIASQAVAFKEQTAQAMSGKVPSSMPSTSPSSTQSASGLGAGGSSGASGSDSESGIEGLEDQVAEHKKGFNANSASNELRLARRAERHEKEAQRLMTKEQREREREAKKAAREQLHAQKLAQREAAKDKKLTDHDNLEITRAENALNTEDKIAALQDQLDQAHDAKDAGRVRSLTLQIETAKAEQTFDDDMAAASQTADGHQSALQQIARMKLMFGQRRAERAADKAGRSEEKHDEGGKTSLLQNLIALRNGAGIYGLGKKEDSGQAGVQATLADTERTKRVQKALEDGASIDRDGNVSINDYVLQNQADKDELVKTLKERAANNNNSNRGGINLPQTLGMFGKGSSLGDMARGGRAGGGASGASAENAPIRIPLSFKEAAPSPNGRQRFEVFGVVEVDSPLMQALGARQ